MRIAPIQNFRNYYTVKNNNVSTNLINNKKITFKAQKDDVEINPRDYDKIDPALLILREKLEKQLKEGEKLRKKEFKSHLDEFYAWSSYNKELEQIRLEYKKINEKLNKYDVNVVDKKSRMLFTYIKQMEKLDANKGFNRIVGYDDIKNDLKNKFIFDSIIENKLSDEAKVPNAMLFYGPTGNGKTLFAKALAEQALMTPYIVNASDMPEEDAMDLIEKYAKLSLETYENSEDKKRSIIIVNEADCVGAIDSPVIDRFEKLIKDCSEKYKCTLFLTTNYPLDLSETILSKDTTPYKVPVVPPDERIVKAIIDKKLKEAGCSINGDIQEIIDLLFQDPSRQYSNGDIAQMILCSLNLSNNPTIEDFKNLIKTGCVEPTITAKKLSKFKKEIEELK